MYGGFVWARGTLNSLKRRLPARTVNEEQEREDEQVRDQESMLDRFSSEAESQDGQRVNATSVNFSFEEPGERAGSHISCL